MFPCRHRGEMFAIPSLCLPGSPESPPCCLVPPSCSLLGKAGGGEVLTFTQETKERPLMSSQRQKEHIDVQWRESFFWLVCRYVEFSFGLAEGQTALESASLTIVLWTWIRFY